MAEGWLATHEDITERQCAEDRVGHMARHDAFIDAQSRVVARTAETRAQTVKRGECLAVLCLDLDHFKSSTIRLATRLAMNC